jgi:hypothetical protein
VFRPFYLGVKVEQDVKDEFELVKIGSKEFKAKLESLEQNLKKVESVLDLDSVVKEILQFNKKLLEALVQAEKIHKLTLLPAGTYFGVTID